MTDRRPDGAGAGARRATRSQRPAALAWGGSGVTFAVVLVLLGWQVAAGSDPAIGDGQAAVQPAAKRVLVRRIVRRVVVTHAAPAAAPAPPGGAAAASASGAPAPAAPAQAPVAPAAPAPAPPTTRSS